MQGKIFGVGVGPGDPDLITVKGSNAIQSSDIIVYHQTSKKNSNALKTAQKWLRDDQLLLPLTYPVTTELSSQSETYANLIQAFYEQTTQLLKQHLATGKTISVLAEGDPLFYSSFMYIFDRLKNDCEIEIIPGVSSLFAAAAALKVPLCYRNQKFIVLSGVLSEEELENSLNADDAFAIIKLGRNITKVKRILAKLNLLNDARYIERASMANEKIISLENVQEDCSPYFSMILIPGKSWVEGK